MVPHRTLIFLATIFFCRIQITLGFVSGKIIVGFIGSQTRVPFARIILQEAEKQLKADNVVPKDLKFEYVLENSNGCDNEVDILIKTKDIFEIGNADLLIGPECTSGMNVAALMAYAFQKPIFGYGSISDTLSDKGTFGTLVRTSKSMGSLGSAVKGLLKYFNWRTVALIHDNDNDCSIALSGIKSEISNKTSAIDIKAEIATDSIGDIDNALKTVKTVARIIILCYGWEPSSSNDFLLKAYAQEMKTPEYVYIIPHYAKTTSGDLSMPWLDSKYNETQLAILAEMYKNVLVIRTTGDDLMTMSDFQNYLSRDNVSLNNTALQAVGSDTQYSVIYDTFYLYGMALNRTFERGKNVSLGTDIWESCQYIQFNGKSGKVLMNKKADRLSEYFVVSMNGSGIFNPMLKIPAIIDIEMDTVNRTPVIIRAESFSTPNGSHPGDTPQCGFDACPKNYDTAIIAVASSLFAVGTLATIVGAYYRKRLFEQSLIKMSWKLSLNDVKLLTSQTRPSSAMWDKTSRLTTGSSSVLAMSKLPDVDKFNTFASVRGVACFAKCYKRQKMPVLRRDQLLLMKRIKEMQHDNINLFLGAIVDDGPFVIACWKYAAKGSLLDVVMNDDIHLDETFVASILKDVILGLDYLHKSSIHYHGSLTVMNCVVDSRWIVKLTDFAWAQFQEHLKENQVLFFEDISKPQQLYHSAPEVLRRTYDSIVPNYYALMRSADMYSFAFIIYHVIYRAEPLYDDTLTPDEVLHRIRKTGTDPLRPYTPEMSNANPRLVSLMHRCWNEDPRLRPSIAEVKGSFVHIFGDSAKGGLLDHMMSILEKYATNLEKVVEERTVQLEAERRRADQLLYQMLPKSVADLLKGGLSVEPESYESVTIYFSDIVGFTSLSSDSTPMEVVTMLNKLYSEFDETLLLYDVYKVETIGDAYMVVSGLPRRNGHKHATEICDMSLSILNVVNNFKIPHKPDRRLRLRIGVHSGSVAAGVVGLTMPRFCLFGDTVNTASRMESNGEPCKIHISEYTEAYLQNRPEYVLQLRGKVALKGKGLVTTYWLLNKRHDSMDISYP